MTVALILSQAHVYLIVAVVLFAIGLVFAGWQREPYMALMAAGLAAVALALLVG